MSAYDPPTSRGVIRCALCDALVPRSTNCSDLGIITLHWMDQHSSEYGELHPETKPYLPEQP